MNNFLQNEIDWNERIKDHNEEIEHETKLRDLNILNSFNEGNRQKYIANSIGLSESTIKHIIARMKKNGENK